MFINDLWQIFSILIVIILAYWLACESFKKYELALFLVVLSPFISAAFVPNIPITSDQQEASLGSYMRISLLILMGGVGFIKYLKSWWITRERLSYQFILLGIFLIFAIFSSVYSIDTKMTFIRSFSFFTLFGFLLGYQIWLKDTYNIDKTLNTLLILIAGLILINLISIFLFPGKVWRWLAPDRFQGLLAHPNMMGSFCMISYPIILWKFGKSSLRMKTMLIVLLIITVSLHALTGSRGSLLASILGICVWFIVQKKNMKLFLFAGIVCLLGFSFIALNPSRFQREEAQVDMTTLTGRTDFWAGSLILIGERPLFGYGFGVEGKVWSDPRFNKPKYALWRGSSKTSLHNGYISSAIGLGLVGFLIWSILLIYPLWKYSRLKKSEHKALVISIMVMTYILNFIETSISGGASISEMVFWISWVLGAHMLAQERLEAV